jgi:hypothetical protein
MSNDEVWPPPVPADVQWQLVVALDPFGGKVERAVREVRLWGQRVLIDADGDVWCDGCAQLVPVAVLGRPGHSHRVGLYRGRLNPLLTDMPTQPIDDDPPAVRGPTYPPPAPGEPWFQ